MDNSQYPLERGEPPKTPPSNSNAVASLICGILSLVCIFSGRGTIIGMFLPIPGIAFAILAMKKSPSGIAAAGLVCSLIGTILATILLMVYIIFGSLAGELVNLFRILE